MNPWRALSTHVKQDVLKQRSGLLPSRSICVDCLVIGRQVSQYRRPKHFLWVNKTYIWSSETKIVKRSTQQRYRKFHRRNTLLSNVVQLSRPFWTDDHVRSEAWQCSMKRCIMGYMKFPRPKRNWKQCLCKILGGKYSALLETWK